MKPTSPRGIRKMMQRKQKKQKPVPAWMRYELAEAVLNRSGAPKMKCVAESEDVCRHLVCPRHRRRLAYCPWEKN